MWGGYGFGIIREVYNRKPKAPFAESLAHEQRQTTLKNYEAAGRQRPVNSIFTAETNREKVWRYIKLLFVLMGLAAFIVAFAATFATLTSLAMFN